MCLQLFEHPASWATAHATCEAYAAKIARPASLASFNTSAHLGHARSLLRPGVGAQEAWSALRVSTRAEVHKDVHKASFVQIYALCAFYMLTISCSQVSEHGTAWGGGAAESLSAPQVAASRMHAWLQRTLGVAHADLSTPMCVALRSPAATAAAGLHERASNEGAAYIQEHGPGSGCHSDDPEDFATTVLRNGGAAAASAGRAEPHSWHQQGLTFDECGDMCLRAADCGYRGLYTHRRGPAAGRARE